MFRMFMSILIVASTIIIMFSAIPFDSPTASSGSAVVHDGEITQSMIVIAR